MSLTNPMGDFALTDPRAMRALAHPVRLAILTHLQRHGPATATQLSVDVGATPSVTSWHLRHLAGFGLVRDADDDLAGERDGRQRWWQATARGFRFETPDDEEGQEAARMLAAQMHAAYDDLPRIWLRDVEPHLPPKWRAESGMSNTRLTVTVDELAEIQRQVEELLAPFVIRPAADVPAGSRGVRYLRYMMPEADEGNAP
jgi:DNA-binding transcriptional ArsR family regulator